MSEHFGWAPAGRAVWTGKRLLVRSFQGRVDPQCVQCFCYVTEDALVSVVPIHCSVTYHASADQVYGDRQVKGSRSTAVKKSSQATKPTEANAQKARLLSPEGQSSAPATNPDTFDEADPVCCPITQVYTGPLNHCCAYDDQCLCWSCLGPCVSRMQSRRM